MANTQTVQGARASLMINGQKVAFVGGVNVDHTYDSVDISVLDQLEIAEIAITGHTCSFSCNYFKVDANASAALGLEPSNLDDLLTRGDLSMMVYDRLGAKALYTMEGVQFLGGSGSISAKDVWQGTWNFKGIRGKGIQQNIA